MTKPELWEHSFNPYSEGVMSIRKRQKTKGELVRKFYRKGGNQMPVIDTDVREGADDITEGVSYEIVNVEEIVTDVQNLNGIRVTLLSAKAEEGNVVLWQRKVTGTGSKLGVFIVALGKNTDRWLHQWVVFVKWQPRDRVLDVVNPPAASKVKSPSPKVSSSKK